MMIGEGNFVGLEHYQDGAQFGGIQFASQEGMNTLLAKALSAGGDTTNASGGFTNGRSLIVESLENTLKVVTYSEKMIKFWQDIQKLPAYSPVEEYNVQTSYAAEGSGAFLSETDMADLSSTTPTTSDQALARKVALVKYMGTTRVVTHPMTLVRTAHGDPVSMEAQAGTRFLLKTMEVKLFEGDSVACAAEFDGVYKQIVNSFSSAPAAATYAADVRAARNSDFLIDMRGEPLTEDAIETAVNIAVQNYGMPTDIYLSTKAMADLGKIMYPKERVNLPLPSGGTVGYAIKSVTTQSGTVNLKPDVFLDAAQPHKFKTLASAAVGLATKRANRFQGTSRVLSGIPSGSVTAFVLDDALFGGENAEALKCLGGQWQGFTGSGAAVATQTGILHFYCITASNQYGESAPVFLGNGTATTSYGMAKTGACAYQNTQAIKLGTAGASGLLEQTGEGLWSSASARMNIYRATVKTQAVNTGYAIDANTKFYQIASLPIDAVVGAGGFIDGDPGVSSALTTPTGSFYDLNETIPGCSNAYVIEHGNQTLSFKQLAPLMKLPLATVTPAIRFALLLYGVPILYAPRKAVIFRNVAGVVNY